LGDSHPSILHIWNTAGVACTLAKWTNRIYGANTDVYAMKKHDPFGHITYGEPRVETGRRFLLSIRQNMQNFDVIHLHELGSFIHKIKKYYPRKPVVLHYHGTDIRGRWNIRRRCWSKANMILVSTLNLLEGAPEEARCLPNPVDTDLFYPSPNSHEVNPNSALTFRHGAVDIAEELAEKHGLELHIHYRNKRFLEMPHLLRRFNWYIDTKRNNVGALLCRSGDSGSMTGLEALACGLKVINSDGEIRDKLPPQHRAENAVRTLHSIYVSLMK